MKVGGLERMRLTGSRPAPQCRNQRSVQQSSSQKNRRSQISDSEYPTDRGAELDVREGQSAGYQNVDTDGSSDGPGRNGPKGDEQGHLDRDLKRGDADVAPQVEAAPARADALVSDPESLRRRWESVQVGFVDDPPQAVGEADSLVSVVIEDVSDGFRRRRQRLESRWSEGGDASTDELRGSFQRYRDFFERLLEV
jgi:hypothetical protein